MNIKKKFKNSLELLENAKLTNNPVEFITINGFNYEDLKTVVDLAKESKDISLEDYYKYYNTLKTIFPMSKETMTTTDDQTIEESFDSRTSSTFIREGELIKVEGNKIKKITSYKFDILIKDKPTFSGELSRTEMELIYRLYSSEGANLAVKSLAREFPQYTQQEIKKILRAFSITKACSPLAPHQTEEMSVNDAVDFSVRIKENTIIKKAEEERIRRNEVKVKELTKEISDLKNKQNQLKAVLDDIKFPSSQIKFEYKPTGRTLIISLSDIHVGAAVSQDSIYYNEWDECELNKRFNLIIKSLLKFKDEIDNITVFNLGDSLDGYKGETTRGGHLLPQNMNDKEQVKVFVRQMLTFFDNLYTNFELPMSYFCVGESNHKIISY